MLRSTISFFLLCALINSACGIFYLPGVAPVNFRREDPVDLKVNKVTSIHTQLPYKYYDLDFCKPDNIEDKVENLGEILRGDRIESSLYKIEALIPTTCVVLECKETPEYDTKQVTRFSELVGDEYKVHWVVDNLESATVKSTTTANGETATVYESGFSLGIKGGSEEAPGTKEGVNYLNNHVDIKLLYHRQPDDEGAVRIVGFEVEPKSYDHGDKKPTCTEGSGRLALQIPEGKDKLKVVYTYSVTWEESETLWANRWDKYLYNLNPQIHWFSIINSLMIVLFLTGMVAMIMMRTLHADFRRYNNPTPANEGEEVEETGWKLVHGDVFRPPSRPLLLAVLVGNGIQVIGMSVITLTFAVLGFLSPANRGGLMTAGLVLYVVMGIVAGYSSTRLYKMFKGTNWKKCAAMTSVTFPGVIFLIFFVLDMVIWGEKSSGAVPFGTMVALVALWFGISVPLCFVGSYFAFKKPVIENPGRTNQIPRQIPDQIWYMSPGFSVMMGGILPFGAVFIELFFIMGAIWGNQFYYIFGFLFIVFIILVLTCAEITIVMCYFQLCSEDYKWWWRSFLTSGASGFYLFLYSIFYFVTQSQITKPVSGFLYFGYTLIMALFFSVLTGAIGFYACFLFVRKIYSQLKVE